MGFIDDQRVVLVEPVVTLGFGQEDAIGHQFDVTLRPRNIGKPDLVTDHLAKGTLHFLADATGNAARGDATRLSVADESFDAAPQGQTDLRQLSGFTRTRFTAHYHHLIGFDSGRDFLALLTHGQGFIELDLRQPTTALGHFRLRLCNLGFELCHGLVDRLALLEASRQIVQPFSKGHLFRQRGFTRCPVKSVERLLIHRPVYEVR